MDYKELFDLSKKICVVTGGTGYLGSECVKALADFGATVVSVSRNTVEQRWAGASHEADLYLECDVSSSEAIRNCFKTINDKYGRIDVLVNCASYGAGYGQGSQLEFMSDEVFSKGIDGTIGVVFRTTREVIPYMKENGGSIINFGSMYGVVAPDLRMYGDNPQRQPANYGAGKAAVDQITRYSASALAEFNIRVNSVTPGPFPNPLNQKDIVFNNKLASKTMLGRFGKNYEIAGAVVLLSSEASSFMTGANITVDGGWTAW